MGKIILIGGNVYKGIGLNKKEAVKAKLKKIHPQILERFLLEMKGRKSKIEIITAASKTPKLDGKEYKQALELLGCENIGLLHFKTPKEADTKKYIDRLNHCDGLMFTGGDQVLICKALLKSKFLEKMKKRFKTEQDFLVAGTSAGAMAMPEIMIARGAPSEALEKGNVKLSEGLSLLPGIIIDTHFNKRERFGRLIEAVSTYPKRLGIGLGEDTAVFLKSLQHVETIGSNLVVLIDASHSKNNIDKIRNNELICVENIKLHILSKDYKFNILKRKIFGKTKILPRD